MLDDWQASMIDACATPTQATTPTPSVSLHSDTARTLCFEPPIDDVDNTVLNQRVGLPAYIYPTSPSLTSRYDLKRTVYVSFSHPFLLLNSNYLIERISHPNA